MKKATGIAALILLGVFLTGILLIRMRLPSSDQAAGSVPEELPMTAAEQTEPEKTVEQSAAVKPDAEVASAPTAEETAPTPTQTPLRKIILSEDDLPEELLRRAERQGIVSEEEYQTRDLVSDLPYEIDKDVTVYLPYGYDPQERYDVLILLHCAWADHRFWLLQDRNYGREEEPVPVSVPNLLDRMIEEGYCRPLIVVSPCIYLYDRQPSTAGNSYDYAQFAKEIRKDFLPWIAENYATYASDGSREALREARDHFGVLGASFGAYATYISIIGDNFDLVAWYTFCGGGEIDPGYLVNSWTQAETSELPLRMLYICEGEFDDRAGPESSYYNLVHFGNPFEEKNVKFTLVSDWGHEDHSYLVGLYNTLQMFFRES